MAAASSSHPPARVNRLMRSTGRGTVSDREVRLISALTAASVPACPETATPRSLWTVLCPPSRRVDVAAGQPDRERKAPAVA
jgi:hypothetical protein